MKGVAQVVTHRAIWGYKPGMTEASPKIGIVSLGCPKALVDSERILSKLRAEGYELSGEYDGADLVVVNTCGFLDTAKAESLERSARRCRERSCDRDSCLGVEADRILRAIRGSSPSGPIGTRQWSALLRALPPPHDPFQDLVPLEGIANARHYAYLKISEGCNNRCSFCIIPHIRGDLRSRAPTT